MITTPSFHGAGNIQFSGKRQDKKVAAMRSRLDSLRRQGPSQPPSQQIRQAAYAEHARSVRVQRALKEDPAAVINQDYIGAYYKQMAEYAEMLENKALLRITAGDEQRIHAQIDYLEGEIDFCERVKQDLIPNAERYNPDEKLYAKLAKFRVAKSASGRSKLAGLGLLGGYMTALGVGLPMLPVIGGYFALDMGRNLYGVYKKDHLTQEAYRQEVVSAVQADIDRAVDAGTYPKGTTVSVEVVKLSRAERKTKSKFVYNDEVASKTEDSLLKTIWQDPGPARTEIGRLLGIIDPKKQQIIITIKPSAR